MTTLCEFFRIKKIATRPYHPQSNSPVERYNSVISQCLRAYIDKEQNNWRKLLPSVLMSFRRSPCKESTQFRPTKCSLEKRWIFLSIHKSYAFRRKPWVKMQTAFWRASSRIGEKNPAKQNVSQKREQTAATNNAKSKEPSFNWQVLVKVEKTSVGYSKKLHTKWKGPYYIVKITGNNTYGLMFRQQTTEGINSCKSSKNLPWSTRPTTTA